MLEAMGEWMSFPMYYAFEGAPPPPRSGAAHATIHPYGPFVAGDGRAVMLGIQNEREWASFCAVVLQQPELTLDERFASNSRRVANKPELTAIILKVFSALSAQQVVERLEEARIANANVSTMADVWAHPQLKARGRWALVDTPVGGVPALLPPGRVSSWDARMDAVPAVGEHTEGILAELGCSAEDIEAMRAAGAV
jgi:itaconate CoA-transferase